MKMTDEKFEELQADTPEIEGTASDLLQAIGNAMDCETPEDLIANLKEAHSCAVLIAGEIQALLKRAKP